MSAKVPVIKGVSDAFVVVQGDAGANDSKDADEINQNYVPALDIRFDYAVPKSRVSLGLGGKYYANKDSASFFGTDIKSNFGLDNFSANSLAASSDTMRLIVDLDGTYKLIDNGDLALDLIAGIRGGYLRNELDIRVTDGSSADRVNSTARFFGLGPRIGVSGVFDIGAGFGFDANASAALLIGSSRTRTRQSTENLEGHNNQTRGVPVFDMEMAGSYRRIFGPVALTARLGGQAEYWTNAPDHFRITDGQSTPLEGVDYLFFGPFLKVTVEW